MIPLDKLPDFYPLKFPGEREAKVKKARPAFYRCGYCGETAGHNARACPKKFDDLVKARCT